MHLGLVILTSSHLGLVILTSQCDLCMSHMCYDIITKKKEQESNSRNNPESQMSIVIDSLIDGGNHHCLIDACRDLKSRKNSQNNSRLFASPFITQILFFLRYRKSILVPYAIIIRTLERTIDLTSS